MISQAKLITQKLISDKFGKKLLEDTIKFSDGTTANWTYFDCQPGVVVVALTPDKKIILVKQYRYTLKMFTIENPAGGCHPNQSPEVAARQELLEETGYVTWELISLGKYYDLPSETKHWSHIFLAINCQFKETPKLDNEVEKYEELSVELHPFSEIIDGIGTSTSPIQSAEHTAAILLADKYLK